MVLVPYKDDKSDVKNYPGIVSLSAAPKLVEITMSGVILEQGKCYNPSGSVV